MSGNGMPNIERCADCGHDVRADLYWHEVDGEWACDEVADCKERQTNALREQLAGAVKERDALHEALVNFGQHAESCPRFLLFPDCTCGLDAALNGTGGQSEAANGPQNEAA